MSTYQIDYACGSTMQSRFWIDSRWAFIAILRGYYQAWRELTWGTPFRSFKVTKVDLEVA